jgi:hypothetical protein
MDYFYFSQECLEEECACYAWPDETAVYDAAMATYEDTVAYGEWFCTIFGEAAYTVVDEA